MQFFTGDKGAQGGANFRQAIKVTRQYLRLAAIRRYSGIGVDVTSAQIDYFALAGILPIHGFLVPHFALKEAWEDAHNVRANDHQQINAIFDFG
jgi:hypothetical protein